MSALRILVIEDEAMIGMLLADLLSSLGHTITDLAFSEEEAIASASRSAPDLVIADVTLGEAGGDGVSAVDTILLARFVPHVFVSGDTRSVQARRPGAIVLQKPFFEHELVHAIDRALAAPDGRGVRAHGATA